jgi:hypothetical protein
MDLNSQSFWDFSFHEIGQFDLPAMIDFALSHANQENLHFIGHSTGATAFFVMSALHEKMKAKIATMHAFAPLTFMSKLQSPLLKHLAPFVNSIEKVSNMLGFHEFLPSNSMLVKGGKIICESQSSIQELCTNVLFLICGYDSVNMDRKLLPIIAEHSPAGTSRFY